MTITLTLSKTQQNSAVTLRVQVICDEIQFQISNSITQLRCVCTCGLMKIKRNMYQPHTHSHFDLVYTAASAYVFAKCVQRVDQYKEPREREKNENIVFFLKPVYLRNYSKLSLVLYKQHTYTFNLKWLTLYAY